MSGPGDSSAPHLPSPALIDAYGNGGFRFGGMSHRGSLLCLPNGIWAWPIASFDALSEAGLSGVFEQADALDIFLLGCGDSLRMVPETLRAAFRSRQISLDAMTTGAAIRTYNVLFSERRRVGAGLIAVA
jgi:uncharacterized protein